MTEEERKTIYGKKVFFLTQNKILIETIKTRLITMEYEIYILNEIKIVKNILSENPNSILFITPDFHLSLNGWKNFIKSLQNDYELKSTQIGILTNDMSETEMTVFKSGLTFKAGIEEINKDDMDSTFRYIVKMLDSLDAKGMRQYVRANCISDESTEAFWLEGNIMHKFRIVDISAVGIALQLPKKHYDIVKNLQSMPSAKLVLKSKHIPISFDVKMIKPSGNGYILIAMFQMGVKKEALYEIRNYISSRLLENLREQISSRRNDETDYENIVIEDKSDDDLGKLTS